MDSEKNAQETGDLMQVKNFPSIISRKIKWNLKAITDEEDISLHYAK